MFSPTATATAAATGPAMPAQPDVVERVFSVLHGFYGSLFLAKWSSGETVDGEDSGVLNARRVWGHALRGFDAATIKLALRDCQNGFAEYPPNLPQFVALCRARTPSVAYKPLPSPKADPERMAAQLAKLAAIRAEMAGRAPSQASRP